MNATAPELPEPEPDLPDEEGSLPPVQDPEAKERSLSLSERGGGELALVDCHGPDTF